MNNSCVSDSHFASVLIVDILFTTQLLFYNLSKCQKTALSILASLLFMRDFNLFEREAFLSSALRALNSFTSGLV